MILAIDQGTTGTLCLVLDDAARVVGRAGAELSQSYPRPGWVEHDPEEIVELTLGVARSALAEAGIAAADLDGIGITNQRETAVLWDARTGRALHPAIVWQDRRTAGRCEALRAAGHEPLFRERTGLVLDSYFAGTKYAWLVEHAGASRHHRLGTIDSWLVARLTGEHLTDVSNAARTLLLDLRRLDWDEELCALLGVPAELLPAIRPTVGDFGVTRALGAPVPVLAVAGDQQAALFGHGCHSRGEAKCTYGTGNFVLHNAGTAPQGGQRLIETVAWRIGERVDYALESSVFVTGAAVQWLRDGLGIITAADETEPLAASVESNGGVYFVPALTGLGSPHWDPHARGTVVGITRGTTRAHLARAALEAIAFQTADAVLAHDDALGARLPELRVDGGPTANAWLMQFQADVLGLPVHASLREETTATGAAHLAGIAAGIWSLDDLAGARPPSRIFEPRMVLAERERLLAEWRRALDRARGWARSEEA